MNIKSRHLKYAFQRSFWILLFTAPVFAAVTVWLKGSVADFLIGMTPILLLSLGLFLFYLVKTQASK